MIVGKYTQLNYIGDIWEPHYNGDPDGTKGKAEVYIAKKKVTRSKLDIKLRFTKVGDTSAYTGAWYLRKKDVPKRTKFDNNGLECYIVPWTKFERLIINDKDERLLW